MRVIDAIIALQQQDPNMEIVFDATQPDAEMFKFVSVDIIEEIETEDGDKFVMLACGLEKSPISEN